MELFWTLLVSYRLIGFSIEPFLSLIFMQWNSLVLSKYWKFSEYPYRRSVKFKQQFTCALISERFGNELFWEGSVSHV